MIAGDLAIGIAALAFLSAGLFWVGLAAARRTRAPITGLVAASTLALMLVYGFTLLGTLTMAWLLPVSNVIVVGNWLPLGAGVLMGILAGQRAIPAWRRGVFVALLASVAWYPVAADLLAPGPPPGRPRFFQGVCLQTTTASCSACSATALLMEHQIPATEAEMMKLCLTRRTGTPELGLYRGLKLKTANTDWDVEVLRTDLAVLRDTNSCPAILLIEVDSEDGRVGWKLRSVNHTIVVYGFTKLGSAEIADPGSGRERLSFDCLRERFRGSALRLVPRR